LVYVNVHLTDVADGTERVKRADLMKKDSLLSPKKPIRRPPRSRKQGMTIRHGPLPLTRGPAPRRAQRRRAPDTVERRS